MTIPTDPLDSYIPTPQVIDEDGLLVGWSLEHKKKLGGSRPIGFLKNLKSKNTPDTLEPILHKGPGHLMTIASTGAGKGVGCIIPALLRHKGPVVVIDPKGENYAVTARARREMRQEVVLLDPYRVTGDTDTDGLNPLDIILKFEGSEIEHCKMLAEMIVVPNPYSRDKFWDNKATELITALLLFIAEKSPQSLQNFNELRYLLNQTRDDMEVTVREMMKSGISECKLVAQSMSMTEPKVLASIISTAQSHTNFMAGNQALQATSKTSFDLEDIILGKPLSLYIVIPPDKIDISSQLIRLWIGTLFSLVMMRSQVPNKRTLFILDEAAQLGYLSLISKAITLLRGYGLQTWSFWQDISQLSSLYPEWETLYNNCHVHQNFGVTNARLARQISQLTDYPFHREILNLDKDEMILQVAGDEAIIAQRPNYLTDALFKGQADPNPYHTNDDEDDLKPQRVQRRYKRRENQNISTLSEMEYLKQELRDAIKEAKQASEEAQQAKQDLEKLMAEKKSIEKRREENIITRSNEKATFDLLRIKKGKKIINEEEESEPWDKP